jgi:hypothetical protein
MTSQNPTEKDPKAATAPPAVAATNEEKPDKLLEAVRELTDEEIGTVAGGFAPSGEVQPHWPPPGGYTRP